MSEIDELELELRRAQIRRYNAQAECLERKNEWERVEDAEVCHYTFVADVDAESVTEAISELDAISRRRPGNPITIVFNTNGGNVFDGMALYDFITELRTREHFITTVALGAVFSMGSILLQAGDQREMSKHSYMMIHEVATDTGYLKASGLRDEVRLLDRLEEQGYTILAERSTRTAAELKERADRKDWYLNSEETVRFGLADAVR